MRQSQCMTGNSDGPKYYYPLEDYLSSKHPFQFALAPIPQVGYRIASSQALNNALLTGSSVSHLCPYSLCLGLHLCKHLGLRTGCHHSHLCQLLTCLNTCHKQPAMDAACRRPFA